MLLCFRKKPTMLCQAKVINFTKDGVTVAGAEEGFGGGSLFVAFSSPEPLSLFAVGAWSTRNKWLSGNMF